MNPPDAAGKTCLKCNHTRLPTDPPPDIACPACGAIYAKVEAAMAARQAAASPVLRGTPSRFAAPASELVDAEDIRAIQAIRERESTPLAMAHIVYLLFLLPVGFTALIGVVIAYVMRSPDGDDWLTSHFNWQIGTFWRMVVSSVLFLVLITVLVIGSSMTASGRGGGWNAVLGRYLFIGVVVLIIGGLLSLWLLWRTAKGWWHLFKREDMA